MKTVLLCRVSSKEQEETGYSLSAQEKLLNEYSLKHQFNIVKVFSISESASGKKQRETFSEMMRFVLKNSIKNLVCEKVDRLTRNFKDAVMIDEWLEQDEERQVHLVKDSLVLHKNSRSQEKLNWGIRILFAKNYIDNLSEEVKKGQKEKISQGWLPTRPPLGYKTVGEKGHKTHIIDKDVAPLILKMFELYATGNYSLSKLTKKINTLGLRNQTGNAVVKSRIHFLLSEPFYIGQIRWNNTLYTGKQAVFIDKALFKRVQDILKGKNTPKYSRHDYSFKGLLKCSECRGVITWEKHKGILYGHCNHYRNCSQKTWSKEHEIEKQMAYAFENFEIKNKRLADWIRKALKESHKDEIEFRTKSVEELLKRKQQLELRLDRLYDDKLDNKIQDALYDRKYNQFSIELTEVDEQIKNHGIANIDHIETGVKIYDLSQRAKELFLKANIDEKRELIRLVFQQLTLDKGKLDYTYTPTFSLLSKAIQKTNSSKLSTNKEYTDKIFEPLEIIENTEQKKEIEALRSDLLPR